MREILSICLGKILGAFALWLPVLLGTVILLSGLVVWWSRRRLRRWCAGRRPAPSRTRLWAVWLVLISVQLIGLPAMALIISIPFCLERGVAAAFESASPKLVDWVVRAGGDELRDRLHVEGGHMLVDLGALENVLDDVRPVTLRARGLLGTAAALPELAANQYVAGLRSVLDQIVEKNPNLTWDDLLKATDAQVASAWRVQAHAIGTVIRTTSLRHISFLVPTVLLVDALTMLYIWSVIRPRLGRFAAAE